MSGRIGLLNLNYSPTVTITTTTANLVYLLPGFSGVFCKLSYVAAFAPMNTAAPDTTDLNWNAQRQPFDAKRFI